MRKNFLQIIEPFYGIPEDIGGADMRNAYRPP